MDKQNVTDSVPSSFSIKITEPGFSLFGCDIWNGSSLATLGMSLHKGNKHLLLATSAVDL